MNDENQLTQTENNQMSNTKTETMSENQLNQNEQMENVNTNENVESNVTASENVENSVSASENVDSNTSTTTPEKTQEDLENDKKEKLKKEQGEALAAIQDDLSGLGIVQVKEVRGGKSHVSFKDKVLNSITKELKEIDNRIKVNAGTGLRVVGTRKTPQGLQDKLENRFWKPSKTNENNALLAIKVSGRRVNLFGAEESVGKPAYFTVPNDLESIKSTIIKLRDYIKDKIPTDSPIFAVYEEKYNKEIADDKFAEITT